MFTFKFLLQPQQIEDDDKRLDVLNLKKSPNKNISEDIEKEDTNSKGDPGEESLKESDDKSGSTGPVMDDDVLFKSIPLCFHIISDPYVVWQVFTYPD